MKKIYHKDRPFFLAVPAFLWQSLFFYLPLCFILILSVIRVQDTGIHITFEHVRTFLHASFLFITFKSLILALATSILCFFLAYPLAYFISFRAKKFKTFFLFLLIVPFWTNFLLHIYAWFFVLERSGFLNTILLFLGIIKEPLSLLNSLPAVLMVMVYCYMPFMALPIYAVLERFDRQLIEASADLGASTWQTWIRVLLPLSFSGVQSGFFLVFVPAFGEFAIPGLVGGDKYVFVGSVISQYMLGYRTMSLGAAFTIISCVALIVVSALLFFLMKKGVKQAKGDVHV